MRSSKKLLGNLNVQLHGIWLSWVPNAWRTGLKTMGYSDARRLDAKRTRS